MEVLWSSEAEEIVGEVCFALRDLGLETSFLSHFGTAVRVPEVVLRDRPARCLLRCGYLAGVLWLVRLWQRGQDGLVNNTTEDVRYRL